MTEKQLIGKIRLLRQIKPQKDWVVLTKGRILGQPLTLRELFVDSFRIFPRLFFQYKFAFATLVVIVILGSTFGFAQSSVPGDFLFVFKKITEKTRAVFVSETEGPRTQLELANKRLEELTKIAESNQTKKLAPAINEFQANVSGAAKKLAKIKEPGIAREAGKIMIIEIKRLEENKKKAESLGVVIGNAEEREIESAMCKILEREIKNLGTITNEQGKFLNEAEEFLKEGKCSLAFEKILFLSNLSME